jgi:hypothetical protein
VFAANVAGGWNMLNARPVIGSLFALAGSAATRTVFCTGPPLRFGPGRQNKDAPVLVPRRGEECVCGHLDPHPGGASER